MTSAGGNAMELFMGGARALEKEVQRQYRDGSFALVLRTPQGRSGLVTHLHGIKRDKAALEEAARILGEAVETVEEALREASE